METPIANFGNPGESQLRWNWEDTPGVPRVAGFKDIYFSGETLTNDVGLLDREAITPGGEMLESIEGKITPGGDFMVDALNADQDYFPFAAFFGKATAATNPAAGAYVHRLSRLESGITFPETFSMYAYRKDGIPQRMLYGRFGSLELDFEKGKLNGAKFGVVSAMGDYWGNPVRVVGTNDVHLRGVSALNFDPHVATDNVHVKITVVGALTYTALVKVGDATAWGAITQELAIDGWTELKDEAGLYIGNKMSPVEVFAPAGMAVNDVVKVPRRRAVWASTFADPSLATKEVSGRIYMDEVESEFTSDKVTLSIGAESVHGFGRRMPRRTQSTGQQKVKISLKRDYLDLRVRELIELGRPFAVVIDAGTDIPLGASTALDYGFRFISPRVKMAGKTATVDKATSRPSETLDCTAFESDDATYPASMTCEVRSSIADLLAA